MRKVDFSSPVPIVFVPEQLYRPALSFSTLLTVNCWPELTKSELEPLGIGTPFLNQLYAVGVGTASAWQKNSTSVPSFTVWLPVRDVITGLSKNMTKSSTVFWNCIKLVIIVTYKITFNVYFVLLISLRFYRKRKRHAFYKGRRGSLVHRDSPGYTPEHKSSSPVRFHGIICFSVSMKKWVFNFYRNFYLACLRVSLTVTF